MHPTVPQITVDRSEYQRSRVLLAQQLFHKRNQYSAAASLTATPAQGASRRQALHPGCERHLEWGRCVNQAAASESAVCNLAGLLGPGCCSSFTLAARRTRLLTLILSVVSNDCLGSNQAQVWLPRCHALTAVCQKASFLATGTSYDFLLAAVTKFAVTRPLCCSRNREAYVLSGCGKILRGESTAPAGIRCCMVQEQMVEYLLFEACSE